MFARSSRPALGRHLLVLQQILILLLLVGLVLGRTLGTGARGVRCGGQALRCIPEAEALGRVSQVQRADVKDVFEVGGVRGVGPQEGLQRW